MLTTVSGWMVETRLREKRRAHQTARGNTRGFDSRNKAPPWPRVRLSAGYGGRPLSFQLILLTILNLLFPRYLCTGMHLVSEPVLSNDTAIHHGRSLVLRWKFFPAGNSATECKCARTDMTYLASGARTCSRKEFHKWGPQLWIKELAPGLVIPASWHPLDADYDFTQPSVHLKAKSKTLRPMGPFDLIKDCVFPSLSMS